MIMSRLSAQRTLRLMPVRTAGVLQQPLTQLGCQPLALPLSLGRRAFSQTAQQKGRTAIPAADPQPELGQQPLDLKVDDLETDLEEQLELKEVIQKSTGSWRQAEAGGQLPVLTDPVAIDALHLRLHSAHSREALTVRDLDDALRQLPSSLRLFWYNKGKSLADQLHPISLCMVMEVAIARNLIGQTEAIWLRHESAMVNHITAPLFGRLCRMLLKNYETRGKIALAVVNAILHRNSNLRWDTSTLDVAIELVSKFRGRRAALPLFQNLVLLPGNSLLWLQAVLRHINVFRTIETQLDAMDPDSVAEAKSLVIHTFITLYAKVRHPYPTLTSVVIFLIRKKLLIPCFDQDGSYLPCVMLQKDVPLPALPAHWTRKDVLPLLELPPDAPAPHTREYLQWCLKKTDSPNTSQNLAPMFAAIAEYVILHQIPISRSDVQKILQGLELPAGTAPTSETAISFWEYAIQQQDSQDPLQTSDLALILKTLGGSPIRFAAAIQMASNWLKAGQQLDEAVGEVLLRIACRGYLVNSSRVLGMLRRQEVALTTPMFQSLMLQAFHQQEPRLMVHLWRQMETRGLEPHPASYSLMIRGLAFHNFELAFQLNEKMIEVFRFTSRNLIGLLLHSAVEHRPNRLDVHVRLWNSLGMCTNPQLRPAAVHRLMTSLLTHQCWTALQFVCSFVARTRMNYVPLVGRLETFAWSQLANVDRSEVLSKEVCLKQASIRLTGVQELLDLSLLWRGEELTRPTAHYWAPFTSRKQDWRTISKVRFPTKSTNSPHPHAKHNRKTEVNSFV